jgi:hypothetical protein
MTLPRPIQGDPNAHVLPTVASAFSSWRRDSNRDLLVTSQERIVHGVLARAVLAAQVGCVVQPVRSWSAE